jgi:hypothetical protein
MFLLVVFVLENYSQNGKKREAEKDQTKIANTENEIF